MICLNMTEMDCGWGIEGNDIQNHFQERLNSDLQQLIERKRNEKVEIAKQHKPCVGVAAEVAREKLRH